MKNKFETKTYGNLVGSSHMTAQAWSRTIGSFEERLWKSSRAPETAAEVDIGKVGSQHTALARYWRMKTGGSTAVLALGFFDFDLLF